MKCLVFLGAFAFLAMALALPTPAAICNLDVSPAATLLLPYFEVDLNDPNSITTLVSVNNASNAGVLAHVTVWSDLSVPVLTFNIYLTGYDIQTLNLRDMMTTGILPQTAPAGQDPNDTISPKGPKSRAARASCRCRVRCRRAPSSPFAPRSRARRLPSSAANAPAAIWATTSRVATSPSTS